MKDQLLIDIEHPILKNHKVYGQELLPGLAYLDMLYQFFREKGFDYRTLELRNFSIYCPLIIGKDYTLLIEIEAVENVQGQWFITVEGAEVRKGISTKEKKRYATAEMVTIESCVFKTVLDIDSLQDSAETMLDMEKIYQQCRSQEMIHTGFMKAEGTIYKTADANIASLSLGEEAFVDADDAMFHPVLIDASGATSGLLLTHLVKEESLLFLPMFYESFRASQLIQKSCFTRIQKKSVYRKKDLLYQTMEFFDANGNKVGEVKNFANKLVREQGLINPERKEDKKAMMLESSKKAVPEVTSITKNIEASRSIELFLKQLIAERIQKPVEQISSKIGYYEMGLSSAHLLEVVKAVENKIGLRLLPTLLFEYTTIAELSDYLEQKYAAQLNTSLQVKPKFMEVDSKKVSVKQMVSASRKNKTETDTQEAIAIIGMAGRYPLANNLRELWANLKQARDCITEIPKSRWDWKQLDSFQSPTGKSMSKWGGFIDDVDCFDAGFFRISPVEAEIMNPQERLFLETCWEALEDASYTPQTLVSPQGRAKRNRVGVFVGVMHNDYSFIGSEVVAKGQPFSVSLNYAQIANRVSYFCNFHGPSMAIDTVCSSSLTAIHMALESIRHGESDVCLAGGVNLSLYPHKYLTYGLGNLYASDGRCHTFGEGGDGYVSAEGVGAVVFKPLSKAIKDHDHIYAVVKGSAINHVGTVSGITVPSPVAQGAMIEECLEKTGVHPRTISCVEAHGTGTSLGDPIEIEGLVKAYRQYTNDCQYCAISSIKSNMGHAEAAAGISGLHKAALQLYHRTLVASLHSEKLNTYIDFENSPFYVQHKTQAWQQPLITENGEEKFYPRRAGLSSFGATGSNAHVVLEEYHVNKDEISVVSSSVSHKGIMIPLSAKTKESLVTMVSRLRHFLQTCSAMPECYLFDVAYTLQKGRVAMEERLIFVVSGMNELIKKLSTFEEKGVEYLTHFEQKDFYYGRVKSDNKEDLLSEEKLFLEKDPETLLREWWLQGKEEKIALLWVKGWDPKWEILYERCSLSEAPGRISLPTYPFARERYWVPVVKDSSSMNRIKQSVTEAQPQQKRIDEVLEQNLLLVSPDWKLIALDKEVKDRSETVASHIVVIFEPSSMHSVSVFDRIVQQDSAYTQSHKWYFLTCASEYSSIEERFQDYAVQVFEAVKNAFTKKLSGHILLQIVYFLKEVDSNEKALFSGLHGLLKTAHWENPKFRGQLIEVDENEDAEVVFEKLKLSRSHYDEERINFFSKPFDNNKAPLDKCWITRWKEVTAFHSKERSIWKDNGVYLITGGMGGLGLIFAQTIIRQTRQPVLLLTGRSELDNNKQERLDSLRRLSLNDKQAQIEYIQVDITQSYAVRGLIQTIQERFGKLNGIMHSAGVIQDNFILKKTNREWKTVLEPKVKGTVYLDNASKHLHLDFFVLFSSGAGAIGNLGQADYATANAFMDAYAHYRNQQVLFGKRHGQSLSINWPLWKDGGMRVDAATEKMMKNNFGMTPLQTTNGLRAFERALASGESQVMVMEGDRTRMKRYLLTEKKGEASSSSSPVGLKHSNKTTSSVHSEQLEKQTLLQLQSLFGEVAKMDKKRVNPEEPLEAYGINSIMITQLNQGLAEAIAEGNPDELSKTLFYEYPTLKELSKYLVTDYTKECMSWTGLDKREAPPSFAEEIDSPNRVSKDEATLFSHAKAGVHFQNKSFYQEEPIAIIGLSGRYPMADTLDEYWENLKTSKDCISEIPHERWALEGFFCSDQDEALEQGKSYGKWGGFVNEATYFDPLFFSIPPREAYNIDPQERLFLEYCWRAIEDAGYTREKIGKQHQHRVGVFAGITKTGFDLYGPELWGRGEQAFPHTSFSSVANRVSYFFDFQGPSMPVDTMCSSSLTAIHFACEQLLQRTCELAIAGGVNLYLHPSSYVGLSAQQMLSPNGRCRSFGKGANGFVPGEGVGVALLKPLSDALRDNDNIYAIIRASAINHGGKTNGYTVPNPNAQKMLIRETIDKANINARAISYIEAHGTGTALGDPIEVTGLTQAFRKDTEDKQFCALGSVKSNIGHLEASAGIAGMTKIILQMQHQQLVPSLHTEELNTNINFSRTPFFVQRELSEWKCPVIENKQFPRIAGISSFGAGGANAHVLLEAFSGEHKKQVQAQEALPVIMVLSAKNESVLQKQAEWMLKYIEKQKKVSSKESNLVDIAYTLQTGREAMEERLGMIVHSLEEWKAVLENYLQEDHSKGQKEQKLFLRGQAKSHQEVYSVFCSTEGELDEDLESVINAWVSKQKLKKLLELWVQGFVIDWNKLYEKKLTQPHRLSLPTYPFDRKRYWLVENNDDFSLKKELPRRSVQNFSGKDKLERIPVWEEQAINDTASFLTKSQQTILIVYTASSQLLANKINTFYQNSVKKVGGNLNIFQIVLGEKTEQLSDKEWVCNINDCESFTKCLKETSFDQLFFLSEFNQLLVPFVPEQLIKSQEYNELCFLRLLKYLKEHLFKTRYIDCYVITQDNFCIAEDKVSPLGGGLTGLAYALAQGDYRFKVRNIDLSSEDLTSLQGQEDIMGLLSSEPSNDRGEVIKYYMGKRYRQTFPTYSFQYDATQRSIRQNGVYVIVGGSGAVGEVITRYLIEQYQAIVIWIGTKPEHSPEIQKKIAAFNQWDHSPAYFQADVTDYKQVSNALQKIKQQYPIINGAIFSAMVFVFENSIHKTTEENFLKALNIKAQGSIHFYEVFKEEPLDFMCFFSSIQSFSFTSSKDNCAYASGITFTDTFVRSLQKVSPFPVGSINWGYWRVSTQGTALEKLLVNRFGLIDDEEGGQFFEHFIYLLRKKTLMQALYVRLSEPIKELMNNSDKKEIFIAKQTNHSLMPCLHELNWNAKIDKKWVEKLVQSTNRELFDAWMCQFLFIQIRRMGAFSQKGVYEDKGSLRKRLGIIDKYDRWWDECLNCLKQKGFLQLDEKGICMADLLQLNEEKVLKDWESTKREYLKDPEKSAHASLIEVCLQNLPAILQGSIKATDIIFPDSSMERVENIYKNNLVSDYFNSVIAHMTEAYVKQKVLLDKQTKVRIIEIGAGTGGTSLRVFKTLANYSNHIEYVYTDISKAFLVFAEEHYGPQCPYLRYKLLNIEMPLEGQEVEQGSYDLVIATNVLHATQDIKKTIGNAKALLKTNGILLINEIIRKSIFGTLTFGLLDGWWLYNDADVRIPGSPLLSSASWRYILEQEGFREVCFPAERLNETGQQVLIAESNGICFQQTTSSVQEQKEKDTSPREKEMTVQPIDPVQQNLAYNSEKAIKEKILERLSKTLKVSEDSLKSDVPFSDYGVDSIIGVSFVKQINNAFNIDLNTAIIFDYTKIDTLTKYIKETYGEKLMEYASEQDDISEKSTLKIVSEKKKDINKVKEAQGSFTKDNATSKAIAIVGLSGQFPDADNVDGFWKNLVESKNAIHELPLHYLDQEHFFDPKKQLGKTYCKWGGYLEYRSCFDPLFFNIAPREALSMNPHQRLILQESWKALEDAGYNPHVLSDSLLGVFIGAEPTGYGYETFTGSSDAIIASRLSYFLNLKGPAMVINTGCSSSAVAIHEACESLRNKTSHMAIAGGVCAKLDQETLVGLSQIEMLSPSGQCATFDASSDGTIISEGVGVVVLKRLDDAIENQDTIYGVIEGSGINQDGASNGITAPNGIAQEELITQVYQRYNINPRAISYVEAHGTGTRLGDPVEANALVRAFKQFTDNQNFCAVGSVKSSIGHTSAAAGVIGLIKVLLSIKHKKLPGLMHFKKLNPLIEFENSPFFINDFLREWTPSDGSPRMAALNSFGHSGTNAHFVIREYQATSEQGHFGKNIENNDLLFIPFSAKNKQTLKEYVSLFLSFFKASSDAINLANIAYTLQVGREPMTERVVFLEGTVAELIEKLTVFLQGSRDIDSCWQGKVEEHDKDGLNEDPSEEIFKKWFADKEWDKLATFWVKGGRINWDLFYKANHTSHFEPRRVNLPTYPFMREQYWMPQQKRISVDQAKPSPLHPFVHSNISRFSVQKFRAVFSGDETFLSDHKIKDQFVFPGVAYLEMAREAVWQAIDNQNEIAPSNIWLKNIIWVQPLMIDKHKCKSEAHSISIELNRIDNQEIAFKIQSEQPSDKDILHCQGSVLLKRVVSPPDLDLKKIKAACSQKPISADQCYQKLEFMGIVYGPTYRCIERIYVEEKDKNNYQILAKLSLNTSFSDELKTYILHPGLMDSALQASIALFVNKNTSSGDAPPLPFALEALEIYGKCVPQMWVRIQNNANSFLDNDASTSKIQKIDLDLCDEEGRLLVKMKGFSSKSPTNPSVLVKNDLLIKGTQTLLFKPAWKPFRVNKGEQVNHRLVVFCEPAFEVPMTLFEERQIQVLVFDDRRQEAVSIEERFQLYAIRFFETVQSILNNRLKEKYLIQIILPSQIEANLFVGLKGILNTAALENPQIKAQVIEIDSKGKEAVILRELTQEDIPSKNSHVYYRTDEAQTDVPLSIQKYALEWQEVKQDLEEIKPAWREDGVYLITGGAGGLGLIFASDIYQKTKHSTIILTGRSAFETVEPKLKAICDSSVKDHQRIVYRQVDISQKEDVCHFVQEIMGKYKVLNGIIHSAGVVQDNFILKKTSQELKNVFAPKVMGTVHLDEATSAIELDFFLLFSSGAGVIGNLGQADYAAANAFMDKYAAYRNNKVTLGQCHGHTLSINWPLWQEGGMGVNEDTEKMMWQSIGMAPMQTHDGIQAFYQALATNEHQIMVIAGEAKKIRSAVLPSHSEDESLQSLDLVKESHILLPAKMIEGVNEADFQEKAIDYMKRQLSSVIGVNVDSIEASTPMEKYGIDSIMVMRLTDELEKFFGSLPKTLFFEYQNIRELTKYFMGAYRDKMIEMLNIKQTDQKTTQEPLPNTSVGFPLEQSMEMPITVNKDQNVLFNTKIRETGTLDIAIIGMSGRYPKSNDLTTFWKNLCEGKDCITEIPEERWDYRLYFDGKKNQPGKTYTKWGGFIDHVDQFDALFFNISPREAEVMEPQERLFLECVFETLEDAGYTREMLMSYGEPELSQSVGVYTGVMYQEYQLYGAQQSVSSTPVALSGNSSAIANRISYFFNLHGPSIAIDSMCSSSLTAIHLACQGISTGECELAIAGGVNVSIHPNKYLMLGQGNFASSRGICGSFGEGGDGYVPGEGVGAVLLKPLSKAISDGDNIYGTILSTAINHGGKTNGYTVPNPKAQAGVIKKAWQNAKINPKDISYIEAHGTGTSLGDPIEITALSQAFRKYTEDKQFCAIGSVKSNIGHCESAAGVAGVAKVLLQMKHKQLVPSLHSQQLNPNIHFEDTPFIVQQKFEKWETASNEPRIAGISSFGAGGSNAHLLIKEYVPDETKKTAQKITKDHPVFIVLSARKEKQLYEQAKRLLDKIQSKHFVATYSLSDIAYTLQVGREAMEERLVIMTPSLEVLEQKLNVFIDQKEGNQKKIEGIFRGNIKTNRDLLNVFKGSDDLPDKDMMDTISKWLKNGKYHKLADLWSKGFHFDWKELYKDKTGYSRLSLPTYPFERKRYWVPQLENIANANPPPSLSETNKRHKVLLQKAWKNKPLIKTNKLPRNSVALIVTDHVQSIATLLAKALPHVVVIHVLELASELEKSDNYWREYDGLIDLTGCDTTRSDDSKGLPAYLPLLITWIQKYIEYGHREEKMLLGVTRGLELFGQAKTHLCGPVQAGLYRILQSEYSHLRSRHLDLDPSTDNKTSAQQIVEEFLSNSEEPEVCYRQKKDATTLRYQSLLEEIPLKDNALKKHLSFPEDHVLLITGGTRGIGYLCAHHFFANYGVKQIVLTGRESFPPREQWGQYEGQKNSIANKIRSVKHLETLGAKVTVLSFPLTDKQAMEQNIQDIKNKIGPIGGVIHSAGISDWKTPAFIHKSLEGIYNVFEPKIDGLYALLECLYQEPLQFFILFSSVSAIIPSLAVGQMDYAIANANMDYIATSGFNKVPLMSIQWPSWKETGMGEAKNPVYEQSGLLTLTDKEGLELLDAVLSTPPQPVTLPAVIDPSLWHPEKLMQRKFQVDRKNIPLPVPKTEEPSILNKKKSTSNHSINVVQSIQNRLIELFTQQLKIDPSELETDKPFQDYGVDSIILAQIALSLNDLVSDELDPSIFYEYQTVASLANWLTEHYSAVITPKLSIEKDVSPDKSKLSQPFSDNRNTVSEQGTHHSFSLKKDISQDTSIAIVGLSCRFPGANNLEDYWKLLVEGRSAIRLVPKERWGYDNSFYAGLMDDVNQFDHRFFLLPEEDVIAMDPQALLVLEECLRLFYHAGYTHEALRGASTGVYIGGRAQYSNDEALILQARNPAIVLGQNYLAANVSQFFDLRGPSLVIDTACSSALTAMDTAIQALNNGEISAAIVGGVNDLSSDSAHRIFHQRKLLSKGSDFHIFDRRAKGILIGEGVGMVMLKTLNQALEDSDTIYGVISGLSINNDGRTAGPATPNMEAQKSVLAQALAKSNNAPQSVSYIEANGSGSEITDLLELKAIEAIYRSNDKTPCALGSVKPNIGHLLCAEGIAAFIKVVLMLYHRQYVPFLSGEEPMKHYNLEASPFTFYRKGSIWDTPKRVAGINCFADGGTNAHVILEEWIEPDGRKAARIPKMLPPLNPVNLKEKNTPISSKDSNLFWEEMIWETFK